MPFTDPFDNVSDLIDIKRKSLPDPKEIPIVKQKSKTDISSKKTTHRLKSDSIDNELTDDEKVFVQKRLASYIRKTGGKADLKMVFGLAIKLNIKIENKND